MEDDARRRGSRRHVLGGAAVTNGALARDAIARPGCDAAWRRVAAHGLPGEMAGGGTRAAAPSCDWKRGGARHSTAAGCAWKWGLWRLWRMRPRVRGDVARPVCDARAQRGGCRSVWRAWRSGGRRAMRQACRGEEVWRWWRRWHARDRREGEFAEMRRPEAVSRKAVGGQRADQRAEAQSHGHKRPAAGAAD